MQGRRLEARRRGSALLAVLVMVVAMSGMSAALISTTLFRQSAARSDHERERAFQAARVALDVALYEIREEVDLGDDGLGVATGAIDGRPWSVRIDPPFTGMGVHRLLAAGSDGAARAGLDVQVSDETNLGIGLYGRDEIRLSGSFMTDSYDSSLGTYASQFAGDHAGDEGSVVSNGDIIAGGGMIHGDATPGPGFEVLGDPSNVTGSTAPGENSTHFEDVDYAPPIPPDGDWSGSGTLTAGTYRYDDLELSGGDVLEIDGEVTIYVDDDCTGSGGSQILVTPGSSLSLFHGSGNFKFSGGSIVNQSERPESLVLRSATSLVVEYSGGTDFYGVVYAPQAKFVSSGGSHLYGAVIAREVVGSSDGALHFDRSVTVRGGLGGRFDALTLRPISAEGI